MKKILLSLGTLATIAAPVAAVISCGTTHGGDLGGAKKETEGEAALRKLMEGSSTAMEAWSMTTNDVTNYITTTKTEGIIENLDVYQVTSVDAKKQFVDPTKPVYEKQFTKQDVIDQELDTKTGTLFDDIASDIKAEQKAGKQYGMIVTSIKADTIHTKGSYKVSVFEKKAFVKKAGSSENDIQTSVDILKDQKHFKFDDSKIAEMHGTYTFALQHGEGKLGSKDTSASFVTSNSGFIASFAGYGGAPVYNDRITQDSLYSWTMLKQQDGGDLNGATIKDALYIQNKKDDKFYLRIEVQEGNQSRTVYLLNDLIYTYALPTDPKTMDRDWMTNKFDDAAFKKLWDEELNFQKVYTLFNSMKKNAGQLDQMPPLKELIIEISASINILASTNEEIHTTDFYNEFLKFVKAKYSSDELDHLIVGLQDLKMNDQGKMYTNYMAGVGAKGFNGLIWANNLLNTYTEFITSKTKTGFVPEKISSGDEFKKALDAAKALASEAKAAKQYMDDNSITYTATETDGDVVKQVKDLMAANLATARALPAVMTPITASDDGHLKDAFDALIKEITKQDKVETKDMNIKALTGYVAKDVKLHEGIAKINAAIVSINDDSAFDTDDIVKEIQKLGVKIPGLVNINVSDSILNMFVNDAKQKDDTNGSGGIWGGPSDKLKAFLAFIYKNQSTLFDNEPMVIAWIKNNESYGKIQISGNLSDLIAKGTSQSVKISQSGFKILNAIYTLIA